MKGQDDLVARPPRHRRAGSRSPVLRAVGGKFGTLLCALICLLLSTPLVAEGRLWNLFFALFASAALVASLHAARSGRRTIVIGVVLAAADLVIGRLVFYETTRWLVVIQAFLWLSTLIFVTGAVLGAIFERENVDVETLQAALCVYVLIGLMWVYVYTLVDLAAPQSFTYRDGPVPLWSDDRSRRTEFMRLVILSFSRLSSTSYDDLKPSAPFAHLCTSLEAMSGQVYLAVVIARLVGMHAGQPRRPVK
jgi:hypothetical protein